MKLKRIFSLVLSLSLLASLLLVPAFAADTEKTLKLKEDWRLTSNLDLSVPEGTILTIDGGSQYHIYELGGKLLNTGKGTVVFQDKTILYPAAGDTDAANVVSDGTWDTNESNALMNVRQTPHTITVNQTENGTVTADKATAKPGETVTLTVTPASGYRLDTLTVTKTDDDTSTTITVNNNTFTMPAYDVTVTAVFEKKPSGGGTGGTGSPTTITETVTNPDGSTTTTVTNTVTGTVTETTKNPDGSTQVVETTKDGTVTTTATDKDGNQTETVENTDGSSQTTIVNQDGSASTTTVSENGQVESQVSLPASVITDAEDKGTSVVLPMPAVTAADSADGAPAVTVDLPTDTSAKVEIPVKNVTPGTVALLIEADGTEQVIPTTLTAENGITVTLKDGDTVKIVDNSKSFDDVPDTYWGAEAVAFASSRELFNGTGDNIFSPDSPMNRAMIVTVLARLEGVDTSGGDTWYAIGRQWAMENGISDGTNMEGTLTREQLATMLYRYAGQPAAEGDLTVFTDSDTISPYAQDAMTWAVSNGIIGGMGDGTLAPTGTAIRVEVATMLMRYIALIA